MRTRARTFVRPGKRGLGALALVTLMGLFACQRDATTQAPQPEPVAQVEPAPAPAVAAPAPAPVDEPAAAPPVVEDVEPAATQPAFEPLKLSAEQLKRARAVQPLVAAAAAEYGIEPNLINGIIWTESKFNPRARNRSGARGLMQLMPVTARGMAKKLGRKARPYDPEFSVQAGSKLLSIMLERFDGDEELALFAFARGGGRVRGWVANGETEMPAGVVKFIERVRRGQQTFAELGFPSGDA